MAEPENVVKKKNKTKKLYANPVLQLQTSGSQTSQASISDSTALTRMKTGAKSGCKKKKPGAKAEAQLQTSDSQNSLVSSSDSTVVTPEIKTGARSVRKKKKPGAKAEAQLQTSNSQNALVSGSDSAAVMPVMKTGTKSVCKKKKPDAKAEAQLQTSDSQNSLVSSSDSTVLVTPEMKTGAKSVRKKKKPGAKAEAQLQTSNSQNSLVSSSDSTAVTPDMKTGAKSVRKKKKPGAKAKAQLQTSDSQNSLVSSSDSIVVMPEMKTSAKSVHKKKKPGAKAEAQLQASVSESSLVSSSDSTSVTLDMKNETKTLRKKKKPCAYAKAQTLGCQNSKASLSDSTAVTPDMKNETKSVCKKKKPDANAMAQFQTLDCQNSKASLLDSTAVMQELKTGAKSIRKRKKPSADVGSQLQMSGRQTSQPSTFDSTAVTPELKTGDKSVHKKKKRDGNAELMTSGSQNSPASILDSTSLMPEMKTGTKLMRKRNTMAPLQLSDCHYSHASISNAAVTMEMKNKMESAFKKKKRDVSVVRTEVQLRPSDIRYSQSSISNKFQDGTKIGELLDDIYFGRCFASALQQIEVALVKNVWVSADNRRLWVMKQLENLGRVDFITVKVLKKVCIGKCTSGNGGISVEIRNGPPGGVLYPLMYPEASPTPGKKKRKRKKCKNKLVDNGISGKGNVQDSACETITEKCHLDSVEESSDGFDNSFNDTFEKSSSYGKLYDCHLQNLLEFNEDLQDDETFWNIYSYTDDNSQLDEEGETEDTEQDSSYDEEDAYIETFPVNEYETSMKSKPAYDWFDFDCDVDCCGKEISEKRNIPMHTDHDDLTAITAKHSSPFMIDSKVPYTEKLSGINPALLQDGSVGFDERSNHECRVNQHDKKHFENTSFSRIGNGVHSYGGLHDLAAPYESVYEHDSLEIAYGGIDYSDLCNHLYCDRCVRLRCYRAMDIGPYYEPPCRFLLSGNRASSIYQDSSTVVNTCRKTTSGLHSSGKIISQTTTESSQPGLVDRAKSGITAVLNFFDRLFR